VKLENCEGKPVTHYLKEKFAAVCIPEQYVNVY
jgi:hypothetical protein